MMNRRLAFPSPPLTCARLAALVVCTVATTSCGPSSSPPARTDPIALVTELVIADFDSCTGETEQGGMMGAAYDASAGDRLVESYVAETGRGCVARLEYEIAGWSAFWTQLQGADLSPYSQLAFDVRGDTQKNIPRRVKIELKRQVDQEVSITYVSGITTDWQKVNVNLADFGPTGYTAPLSGFTDMKELVFTFEATQAGGAGVVYLDNIVVR